MTNDFNGRHDTIEVMEELIQELMRQFDLLNGNKVQENISYGQYRILLVIHSRGPISIGKLGALIGLAQSTTSEMIARLKKAGLVTKVKGSYDGRIVMVELTEKGRSLLQKRKVYAQKSYGELFTKLSAQDRHVFQESIKTLSEILLANLDQ